MTNTSQITPLLGLTEYHSFLPHRFCIPEKTKKMFVIDKMNTSMIQVKSKSHFTIIGIFTRGWNERQLLTIRLAGEHSFVRILFFIIGARKETFPFDIRVIQDAKSTNIESLVRNVFGDAAMLDATCSIKIKKNASRSSASFSSNSILCSHTARVRIIPSLEILNDCVDARHAATIGRLDEKSMFYLESRGFAPLEASQILLNAFVDSDLKKIQKDNVRLAISTSIKNMLSESISYRL